MRRSAEVASALQFVFLGKQFNKTSLCRVTAAMKRWTVSRLSSASDHGIALFDKEAGYPGNSIALLEFRAQADDAAVLSKFHGNT